MALEELLSILGDADSFDDRALRLTAQCLRFDTDPALDGGYGLCRTRTVATPVGSPGHLTGLWSLSGVAGIALIFFAIVTARARSRAASRPCASSPARTPRPICPTSASLRTTSNAGDVIHSIVTRGHALDVVVVAEGIETEQQRALLRLAGCDEMQGFLFAEPRPAEAIDKIALRSASARGRDAPVLAASS